MGLQDREERELAEIEQHLAEEDPRFGDRLSRPSSSIRRLSARTLLVVGLPVSYLVGLLIIIGGVSLPSVGLIVLGTVITASFPVALTVRAWLDRRP